MKMQNSELEKKSNRLLSCPFCRGEAKTYPSIHTRDGERMEVWYAMCTGCKINYPQAYDTYATTEEEAIKYWNTRKPMERIVEQLEEAKGTVFIDGKPMYNEDDFIDIDKAIDIVKGGVDNG